MSKHNRDAYFAPLVLLPQVIKGPGQYLTRGGEIVTLTKVSDKNVFGNFGTYPSGEVDAWHRSGRLFAGQESQNDIVSKVLG